ncbi:MAG: DUF5682 family protein [Pseudomonadota bacterium]
MAARIEYFGIRHHGPGSARRLVEALDDLRPTEVLIEGPADLSDQLPLLAAADMVPPVALLAYPKDAPERAFFWPFAVFSPEYQAVRWAIENGVPVRFIDLPVVWRLPDEVAEDEHTDTESDEGGPEDDVVADVAYDGTSEQPTLSATIARDPIGVLAHAAGYEDGESWWRDVIEENPDPGPIFAAVADAMTALREGEETLPQREAAREAHMRLEIAKSVKIAEGAIAVVCGAWHVPALKAKYTAKDDRALIKGAPKAKVTATWAPWTSPRLAFASGYGAGVVAPGWCKHLWDVPGAQQTTAWIARIARAFREEGQIVSTASLIEAQRLAVSLAAVRGRPRPGFEELRDAVVCTLCFGDPILWRIIETRLLLGNEVGEIPENVPAAPLLEDLQRQQKKARLKPEALDRELSLDLRSDAGLFRSTLLHRLIALDTPWGKLTDAGKSRGTFREKWKLRWEPEYAVQLVESLVYGTTIETAATARLITRMTETERLGQLADLVFAAMTAQLPKAADAGTARLAERAGQTSDTLELLAALPGLAEVIRYGKARETDAHQLAGLFQKTGTQAALGLQYAARNLDAEAARRFRDAIRSGDRAIRLAESEDALCNLWTDGLRRVVSDDQSARLVKGGAARLLYEADDMTAENAVSLLGRMLSPGTAPGEAAAFFEGFFEGSGQRLLYDDGLRDCVDAWLVSLDDETFTEYLPVFRRVLSELDKTERKRLLDALFRRTSASTGREVIPGIEPIWNMHFESLTRLLNKGASA